MLCWLIVNLPDPTPGGSINVQLTQNGAGAAKGRAAPVPEDDAGGCGTGQEIAAFTSSATFCSTMGLHFLSAYDTGHTSPSSRFAESWKPKVE